MSTYYISPAGDDPASGISPWENIDKATMTDEEAQEDIRTGHGFRPDYLVKELLACYERYRAKGLSPSDSAKQANLYYLASHAAASFDAKTGLYSAI